MERGRVSISAAPTYMLVTRDTSHVPIGPCSSVARSPSDDSLRHARTALSRSDLRSGGNSARVRVRFRFRVRVRVRVSEV